MVPYPRTAEAVRPGTDGFLLRALVGRPRDRRSDCSQDRDGQWIRRLRGRRAHRGVRRLTVKTRLELPENERLFERCGFARREVEAHPGCDIATIAVMEEVLE